MCKVADSLVLQVREAVKYLRDNWNIKLYGSLQSGYHGWFWGEAISWPKRLAPTDVLVLARDFKELE